MSGRIALLCHWPKNKPFWLEDMLCDEGFSVVRFSRPWGRPKSRLRSLIGRFEVASLGWRATRFAAKNGAAVVAASDAHIAGVFAAIAGLPFGRRRAPVLCINLMLYDKRGLRTYLRKVTYRLALTNPRAMFTVSTGELRDHYVRLLRAGTERFVVLSDCYAPGHRAFAQHDPKHDGGYVFVGGDAARDWETAISAARACSEIPFVFVAHKKNWPGFELPPNVEIRFDIPLGDFYEAMRVSRVTLVPLGNGVVTAGLIVVTHCALMGCLVIATETPATKQYFPSECRDLLVPMGDACALADRLDRYWRDDRARGLAAARLQAFVLDRFSPEAYSREIAAWALERLRMNGSR